MRPVLFCLACLISADAQAATPAEQRSHLEALGIRGLDNEAGKNVTVAILDSGFRHHRAHLVPTEFFAKTFRLDGQFEARDSQHGVWCADAIRTVAPGAKLLLVNWEPDSPGSFLEAVRWARGQGARIFSCSLIMPSWSDGAGGGVIHQELGRILGNEALFFASAGNTAERHWFGRLDPGADGWHRWSPRQTDNEITPWGIERVAVEIYGDAGAVERILVVDSTGIQQEVRTPAGCEKRTLRFQPQPGRRYWLRLQGRSLPESFHTMILGGNLERTAIHGSVPFPADGLKVVAVGAVDRSDRRMSYSACGTAGPGAKPDLVAPVPMPLFGRERPFTGTSAAAPQAAGVAARLWSQHPEWSAERIRQTLNAAAIDLGAPGHDLETGHGRVQAPTR